MARPGPEARAAALARARRPTPPVATESTQVETAPVAAPVAPSSEGASPSTAGRPSYLPGLDGLRAISVAAVVAYHLDELPGGFLGVDVFFVVSGFLITRLLLAERERSGHVALGRFWIRRFRRLVPVLAVVLVAVMVGSRAWLPSWRLTDIRLDAFSALAYVANWRFVLSGQSYFSSGIAPSPLRHTWSLAIEEQFYVLFPLLIVGLAFLASKRLRPVVGIVAAVGALTSAVWMAVAAGWGWDLSRLYYGTDTRAFGLLAGVALAAGWDTAGGAPGVRSRWWSVAAAVAVPVVGAYFVLASSDTEGFYRGAFQAFSLLAVLLVAGVATGRGPLTRALSWGPLVWIGRRSYGIYLWSWPTQVFAQEHFRLEGPALDAVVVAVSLALATLSHWLVEEPIRTGTRPVGWPRRDPTARRDRRPRLAPVALSTAAIVGVVGVISVSAAGAPPPPDTTRVSDQEALDAAVGDISAEEEEALLASTSTTVPVDVGPPGPFADVPLLVDPTASADPLAVFGRPLEVLILGDSVGWSLGWDLTDGFTQAIDLRSKAIIGCGVMPPDSAFIVGSREPETYSELCDQTILAELKGLSEEPDVVLVWVGAWEVYDHEVDGERLDVGSDEYRELFDEELQARVDRARGNGIPTVMALVPCFAPNAARLGTERQDPDRVDWVNEVITDVAERSNGWVRLIDPQDQLCDAEGEPFTETPDGDPLRQDGSHFDPPAATWFWNSWLAGQMAAAYAPAGP